MTRVSTASQVVITTACILYFLISSPITPVYADDKVTLERFSIPINRAWAMAWLPDRTALVTERGGTLYHLSVLGKPISKIAGVPDISAVGQGGLLDVQIHPDYARNQRVYLCYSQVNQHAIVTSVGYGRLKDEGLDQFRTIFAANAGGNGGRHFGCRIRFDDTKRLFVALGERGESSQAQDPAVHPGSILAITDEGKAHPQNPRIKGWAPEVYAIGIRNPQGLLWDKASGTLLEHEHGPQGGDELNLIKPGANYGWPVVSFGEHYGGGKIGDGPFKPGFEPPLLYWTPSIAPSGLMRYAGHAFPHWRGSFFVGSLKFKRLLRIYQRGEEGFVQETILSPAPGRVRDVVTGPDGFIYILFDEHNKEIYRLRPR